MDNCTNTDLFNTNALTNTYIHSNVDTGNNCAPTNTNNDIHMSRNINTNINTHTNIDTNTIVNIRSINLRAYSNTLLISYSEYLYQC